MPLCIAPAEIHQRCLSTVWPFLADNLFPFFCNFAAFIALTLACGGMSIAAPPATESVPVDFARDVQPLLRRSCWECHGAEKQAGDLRLDTSAGAFASGYVIVAGKPDESELMRRIALPAGHAELMPAVGAPLKPREIQILKRWIEAGASWPKNAEASPHWAYVSPQRPALPQVANAEWCRNPIDRFIVNQLEQAKMSPSSEADRATLLRRVSFDLIGLPPTPAELDAFLSDRSPNAYERAVDGLLARPQFGERWARPWLDLARYADSHGFQRDDLRDIWAYRDWVIDALNADMPFDQFTIEQLAGDLLPNASESQRVATGFHRCTPTNVEAGSIPEETRINQVIDRVNTTAAVWLGTTLECAQCHDHKYDPFSQRDYYRLMAFFNSTESEADRTNPKVPGSIQFRGPTMPLSDPRRARARQELAELLTRVQERLAVRRSELDADLEAWATKTSQRADQSPESHLLVVEHFESEQGCQSRTLEDGSLLITGKVAEKDTYRLSMRTQLTNIRAIKLEALAHESLPGQGPGRGDGQRPNFVLHEFNVKAVPVVVAETKAANEPDRQVEDVRFSSATASFSQARYDVAGAIDNQPDTGWAINPKFGQSHWATFTTANPLGFAGGTQLTFHLVQNYGGGRTIGRLRLTAITGDVSAESFPAEIRELLAQPAVKWKPAERSKLLAYRVEYDATMADLQAEIDKLKEELAKLALPTTLVMKELPEPRVTAMFDRGDYRNQGQPVNPGTPEALHPLSVVASQEQRESLNRLSLARWLVDRNNPLVARVTVNRWWAEIFGRGLVATPEDFGIKGETPTHPELLDWLAVEFMDSGWSMKHIVKTMVMSATYRQSATATPEQLAADDQNLHYGRGSRFRLAAEAIRDNALSIAGLLSLKQGGPPIRPYQPDGIWTKVGGQNYKYEVSPGDERYRRGIYVVLKRGAPYPSFVNFDGSARLACTVQRSRTNTPLQALTLLNDPVYVEAAHALAARILSELSNNSTDERLRYAFRLCTAREPEQAELDILKALRARQEQAARSQGSPRSIGGFQTPAQTDSAVFASWYAVATTLLNLDETITKE